MQHAITDRCHWHQQKQKCCLHETFCFLCSARKTKRHQFLKTINNAPTMYKNITQKHNDLLNLLFITLMGKITSLLSMWTWSLPGESVDQPCVFSYDFACWSWDTQSKPPANYKNKQTKKNIQICSWKTRFRVYKAMINSGSTDKMFFCTPCKHNLNDPHDKILLKNKVIYTQKCEEQVGWISSFALQPNDFWVNQLECACMCTQGFTAS